MKRSAQIYLIGGALIPWALISPSCARAQGSSLVTLEVTKQMDITAEDGSDVHVLLTGQYSINATGSALGTTAGALGCGGQPVVLDDIKDGQPVCIKLTYVRGRMLKGNGHGQGRAFQLRDDSALGALHPPDGIDGTISGPQAGGSILVNFRAGPGFLRPSDTAGDDDAMDPLGCWSSTWPKVQISYADLRNLTGLNHTPWTQPAAPPEFASSCHGNATIKIQARCAGVDGLGMFKSLMPVFSHPRCINCHGLTNPLTGENHGGGPIDAGPQTPGNTIRNLGGNTECLTCHDQMVTKDKAGKEHGPWRLPPEPMLFAGKDTKTICEQIAGFGFPNGPADITHFENHVSEDDLIGLGFIGLSGGAAKTKSPPPMDRRQFMQLAMQWATAGSHSCGCAAPPGN